MGGEPATAALAPKPRTPKPGTVSKRKLTVAQAAEQWEAATRAIEAQKALLGEAAPVLLEHLERTGRSTYRDRIARKRTGGAVVLDAAKIKAFLGRRLGEFQRTTELGWSLTLLK